MNELIEPQPARLPDIRTRAKAAVTRQVTGIGNNVIWGGG
jgi:hypothetical protein